MSIHWAGMSQGGGKPAFAWVTFASTEQATTALEAVNGKPIWQDGPLLRVDYHTPRENSSPARSQNEPGTSVFVGGIDTEQKALDLFEEHPYENFRLSESPFSLSHV